jgi:hypothetical protein
MKNTHAWHQRFDHPIASAAPVQTPYRWRPWLCLALMAACFLPRALLAWRADVICEDGPFYVIAAQHLERGELAEAFATGNLRLNTYPILLAWLHGPDHDWVAVGKWLSVVAAMLAVLPMFGWFRRQFNDPVATLACLVYASHPTLIERSPEVLRCPTYWLLLMLTLYLLWRAVIEVRLRWFLLGGLAMALAVHTRVEGWFVLVPWALWSAMRWCALGCQRPRLALGALSFAVMIPAFIVAVNFTWLRDHPNWEFCFSHRLDIIRAVVAPAETAGVPAASSAATPAPVPASTMAPAAAMSAAPPVIDPGPLMPLAGKPPALHKLAWDYIRKLVDAFGVPAGLLALLGLASYRTVLMRRDQVAVLCMSLTTFAAIAAQQWRMGEVIGRYFFPIILVTLPYIALGLHELAHRAAAALAPVINRPWLASPRRWTACLLLAVAAIGCLDALTNNFDSRRQRRDLGQWVLRQLGPNQRIIGAEARELALVYYSQGRYQPLRAEDIDTEWFHHVMQADPAGVVVLFKHRKSHDSWLADRFASDWQIPYRYQTVAAEDLPPSCQGVKVLVPVPTAERLALRPARSH